MSTGEAFKKLREELNLTYRDVSKMSGASTRTLLRFENDTAYNIGFLTLLSLCSALGITLEDLLREAGMISSAIAPTDKAIEADPKLSADDKQMLLQIYRRCIKTP